MAWLIKGGAYSTAQGGGSPCQDVSQLSSNSSLLGASQASRQLLMISVGGAGGRSGGSNEGQLGGGLQLSHCYIYWH